MSQGLSNGNGARSGSGAPLSTRHWLSVVARSFALNGVGVFLFLSAFATCEWLLLLEFAEGTRRVFQGTAGTQDLALGRQTRSVLFEALFTNLSTWANPSHPWRYVTLAWENKKEWMAIAVATTVLGWIGAVTGSLLAWGLRRRLKGRITGSWVGSAELNGLRVATMPRLAVLTHPCCAVIVWYLFVWRDRQAMHKFTQVYVDWHHLTTWWALLVLGFGVNAFRAARRSRSLTRGRPDGYVCDRCGYDAGHPGATRCPECGFAPASSRELRRRPSFRARALGGSAIIVAGVLALHSASAFLTTTYPGRVARVIDWAMIRDLTASNPQRHQQVRAYASEPLFLQWRDESAVLLTRILPLKPLSADATCCQLRVVTMIARWPEAERGLYSLTTHGAVQIAPPMVSFDDQRIDACYVVKYAVNVGAHVVSSDLGYAECLGAARWMILKEYRTHGLTNVMRFDEVRGPQPLLTDLRMKLDEYLAATPKAP